MSDAENATGRDPLPVGEAVVYYGPAVFLALQSAGRDLLTTAMVGQLPVLPFDATAVAVAAVFGAVLGGWTGRPAPLSLTAVPVLAWVVAGGARSAGLFVAPGVGLVSGSLLVLADCLLLWVGAYALASAVVFGLDWGRIAAPVGGRIYPDSD